MSSPDINIKFETERLIIRPFNLSDIEPSYQMNLDPAVSKYTGDGGVVSKTEIERRIIEHVFGDYQKHGYGRLAVILKASKKFIGFTGLKYLVDSGEVDLGYRFMQEYWGKGYATESVIPCLKYGFKTLKLSRIIGHIIPENNASTNVLKKVGFKFEKSFIEEGELIHQYELHPADFNY